MKPFTYQPQGTCSKVIQFDLDDDHHLHNLQFIGGCPGNTLGIARLTEGMKATEIIRRLKGTRCGLKPTSCPDQLALALEEALQQG